MLRWLHANRVEFVLIGPIAEALRGRTAAHGPGLDRARPVPPQPRTPRARARRRPRAIRIDGGGIDGQTDTTPTKLTAEKLARGQLWTLRCGSHDLDIEGTVEGVPGYQELLYETTRFEPVAEVEVEVACPEDVEQYAHVRRTGVVPEIVITRKP